MKNIQFVGRDKELKLLKSISRDNFFLVVKGRRRIGKTTFLKRGFPEAIYLFIWPNKSIGWTTQKICEEYKLPGFRSFIDILDYLLMEKKAIIIDEFQNILNVDKSTYGEIQKLIDEKKNDFLKIAVAGSSYSLMNKVFNDIASPLYGRRTSEINLTHLPIKDLFKLSNRKIEDFIKLWAVFEGVPYYYELMDKENAEDNIKRLILSKNSLLQDEGKAVLSVEFGQDSKTYNTLLMAIAEGKTKLNEISSLFGNKVTETIKYIDILRKDFKLIRRLTPILSDPKKSREGKYEIIDNFLNFWFYFLDKNRDYVEQDRFAEVEDFFNKNFPSFVGRKFESLILQLIKEGIIKSEFEPEKIGRQWGVSEDKTRDKNQYEIDLIGVNKKDNQILIGECKWKDNVEPGKIIRELIEKAKNIKTENLKMKNPKEYYYLFAKSFTKKINDFEGRKVYCIDIDDLNILLR